MPKAASASRPRPAPVIPPRQKTRRKPTTRSRHGSRIPRSVEHCMRARAIHLPPERSTGRRRNSPREAAGVPVRAARPYRIQSPVAVAGRLHPQSLVQIGQSLDSSTRGKHHDQDRTRGAHAARSTRSHRAVARPRADDPEGDGGQDRPSAGGHRTAAPGEDGQGRRRSRGALQRRLGPGRSGPDDGNAAREGGERPSRRGGPGAPGQVRRLRDHRPSGLGRAVLARTVHGLDAGQDEIDADEELLAVVVFAQLRPGFAQGWVSGRVELRPVCGDGGEES